MTDDDHDDDDNDDDDSYDNHFVSNENIEKFKKKLQTNLTN